MECSLSLSDSLSVTAARRLTVVCDCVDATCCCVDDNSTFVRDSRLQHQSSAERATISAQLVLMTSFVLLTVLCVLHTVTVVQVTCVWQWTDDSNGNIKLILPSLFQDNPGYQYQVHREAGHLLSPLSVLLPLIDFSSLSSAVICS